jgi:hypothetical protein
MGLKKLPILLRLLVYINILAFFYLTIEFLTQTDDPRDPVSCIELLISGCLAIYGITRLPAKS